MSVCGNSVILCLCTKPYKMWHMHSLTHSKNWLTPSYITPQLVINFLYPCVCVWLYVSALISSCMYVCPHPHAGFQHVTCGSVLKLASAESNIRLHSHDVKYGSGSGQQVLTSSMIDVLMLPNACVVAKPACVVLYLYIHATCCRWFFVDMLILISLSVACSPHSSTECNWS